MAELHVITGAFGFSGRYIAARLLDAGYRVRTLTNAPHRHNPFGDRVEAHPYHFDDPAALQAVLTGATVLYNTYWVRYNSRFSTYQAAMANTRKLFDAAKAAGVPRIVHVSITNPSVESPLEYFRGKALLEEALIASGLSYAILRPAVLFGEDGILINNIAWALRRLPVFAVFSDGEYRLQPIYVDDLAALAVVQGQGGENGIIQAIGPETFTYRELVRTLGRIIGVERPIISVPPELGYLAIRLLGVVMGDVILTREEVRGLMAGLLCVEAPPAGQTRLTAWMRAHAAVLGQRYMSELARRQNHTKAYNEL